MLIQRHDRAELSSQHMTDEDRAQRRASTEAGDPSPFLVSLVELIFFVFLFQGLNTLKKKKKTVCVVSVTFFGGSDRTPRTGFCAFP